MLASAATGRGKEHGSAVKSREELKMEKKIGDRGPYQQQAPHIHYFYYVDIDRV